MNFQSLTLPIFKKKNNHQFTELKCLKLSPQAQRVLHWRAALSIYATLKTAISYKVKEDTDACGMSVHSGLYIPVSSYIHQSLLDLVIIFPVLALIHTHEPWYAAFKMCWYKATFIRAVFTTQTNLFGNPMLSSHVYVHVGACLFYHTVLLWIVQWCKCNL